MRRSMAERYIALCDLQGGPLLTEIELPAGATLGDALSELRHELGGQIGPQAQCGIWGQRCNADRLLKPGDRIELYRPLPNDPRALRRANAKRSRLRNPQPRDWRR